MSIRQYIVVGAIGAGLASAGPSAMAQTTPAPPRAATSATPAANSPAPAIDAPSADASNTANKHPSGYARKMPYRLPATSPAANTTTGSSSGTSHTSGEAEVATWSPQEVAAAKALCAVVLRGVDAVVETEESIKQGQCGAPAVVKLIRFGKSPEVVLNPPAMVTCEVVASLHKWFKADVQPAARAYLGGSIVKIETMSSYSCRNAYGRSRTKLSEHGRANALDIGGFVTASADVTRVLSSWGATARELRGIASRSPAVAPAGLPTSPAPGLATRTTPTNPVVSGASNRTVSGGVTRSGVITGSTTPSTTGGNAGVASARSQTSFGSMPSTHLPGLIVRDPSTDLGSLEGLGFVAPNRLGGAKPAADAAITGGKSDTGGQSKAAPAGRPVSDAQRTQFLHEIHAAACKYFGTVLGPEANNDHNNHFHVDMAPRKTGNFCE